MEGGRHQEVFGFILAQFKTLLASQEATLRAVIEERVREQGGEAVCCGRRGRRRPAGSSLPSPTKARAA